MVSLVKKIQRKKLEQSLYEFLKKAWSSIEGDTRFSEGWHIQSICLHLEEAYKRNIKRLLINIPPRSSKTSIISVAFPAWVWTKDPTQKFMYSSYAQSLSLEHSLKCRRLIESDWYQSLWGHRYGLSSDQRTKSFFENDQKGYRIATSVGSSSTGKGANFLIADDPNNVKDGKSDLKRKATNSWWDQVWSTRLNNPKEDVKIIVQQRVHQQDVSGHIIENDENDDWVKLILPMEYEESSHCKTIYIEELGGVWKDPREEENELLTPDRFSQKEVEQLKNQLGAYGYAGQFQQRPSPLEGEIIKKGWFKWWKEPHLPEIQLVLQSWDTALRAGEMNAYSACTTWGIFYDENYIEHILLLSMWRGRVEYPELRERAQRLFFDYRDTEEFRNPALRGRKVDILLVEGKVSGDSLIQDLNRGGIAARPFQPEKYGDKMSRVRLITHLIHGGRVWVSAKSPNYNRLYSFAEEFLENCALFPNAESRDLVDTMTQALLQLRKVNLITHPTDPRRENLENKRKVEIY